MFVRVARATAQNVLQTLPIISSTSRRIVCLCALGNSFQLGMEEEEVREAAP